MVARGWVDASYRDWLLSDASEHMIAVENTPQRHNLVVCTLCSVLPMGGVGPAPHGVQERAVPVACGA